MQWKTNCRLESKINKNLISSHILIFIILWIYLVRLLGTCENKILFYDKKVIKPYRLDLQLK